MLICSMIRYFRSDNPLKAERILADNISTLLRARGQSQHDLAQWCRHSDVWLSKFLRHEREIQLKDLDRVADFFGIATYQLFQPGISPLTERRKGGERRSGRDRRISMAFRTMSDATKSIESTRERLRGDRREPA